MKISNGIIEEKWMGDTFVNGVTIHDREINTLFPVRFYVAAQENVIGLHRIGEEIIITKYAMSRQEAVNTVRNLSANELDVAIGSNSKILYDVVRRKVITKEDFGNFMPRKDDALHLAWSERRSHIVLFAATTKSSVIAAFNYSAMFYSKPKGEAFTLAAKKFIHCWVCKTYGFPYDDKVYLDSIIFPALEAEIPLVIRPQKENVAHLYRLGVALIEGGDPKFENEPVTESLTGLMMFAGIDEDTIEISKHTKVEIDIDDDEFSAYIKEASFENSMLCMVTKQGTPEYIIEKFKKVLNWRGSTSRIWLVS